MSPVKFFKEELSVPEEYRAEFTLLNRSYNSKAAYLLSVLTIVLIGGSTLVGYLSVRSGAENVTEYWMVLPYFITEIAGSALALILYIFIHRKKSTHHWLVDLVAIFQICLVMLLVLAAGHIEIPAIGIKNINVVILVMFAIVFCVRFRLSITLTIETVYALAAIILLITERNDISNFYPSLVNLTAAWAIAFTAACMYWGSRVESFVATKKLEALVTSDALTKIHNRRGFDTYLAQAWAKAVEEHSPLSLFIIDIDHFKQFNDSYGHVSGDDCLVEVARVISNAVRKVDLVARYGGEEFSVVLVGAKNEAVDRIANKILSEMRGSGIPHNNSIAPYVTVSIGCMTCHPATTGIDQKEFLTMADNALYMAKEQGRDRFVLHPDAEK